MRYMIFIAVLLAACGSAAPPTGVFTRSESGIEFAVTYAPTRAPTATPPRTSTTIPTGTPVPSPTAYQTPTRAATPTFAPSWTPAPRPTATRAPAPSLLIQAPPPTAIPAPQPAPQPAGQANTGKALPISKDDCPASHPIKGNQGSRSTDTWIYHMPGGGSYAVTDPEECFSTEAAAQAGGYRKALR